MQRVALALSAIITIAAGPLRAQDTAGFQPGTFNVLLPAESPSGLARMTLLLRFAADSTWAFYGDEDLLAAGRYTITDDTLTVEDLTGPIACVGWEPGVFLWSEQDDILDLTLIDDECDGRANAFTETLLIRVQRESAGIIPTGDA